MEKIKKTEQIRIEIEGARAQIFIDGQNVAGKVRSYTLTQNTAEPAKLILELVGFNAYISGDAEVLFNQNIKDGWEER